MTAAEAIGRLARLRLEKASRNLLRDGLYEDSTSRSYYAMFHAVSALLLTKGLSTSKHKGAISLFDLHFIKPRVLDPELSIWIHDAFKARQEADYGEEALDPRAAAETTLVHAEALLERVRPVLAQQLEELSNQGPSDS